jgi:hypothetical protein
MEEKRAEENEIEFISKETQDTQNEGEKTPKEEETSKYDQKKLEEEDLDQYLFDNVDGKLIQGEGYIVSYLE